ncbi:dynein regulatory complex protein 12 [Ambystoma mexicanum]|uniref:dynein regulatory complex protein 12 n=1 Tax=Ambystoma mexicanum TaxID=8296 RepID=UPI0037E715E8
MPPKKKKGKGKKKGKAKKKDGPDGIEEKYRRSTLEVEVLQDHLALRRDVARRAQAKSGALKVKLEELEQELEGERHDKKAIYTEMIRQYKEMQLETDARIHQLETNVNSLQDQLGMCQREVQDLKEEKERILTEKNEAIEALEHKVNSMEAEYEKILHDSLDGLLSKITMAKMQWTEQATSIHLACKRTLHECGLNPLDI